MFTNSTPTSKKITKVAAANIVVALAVICLKYAAYVVSGSVALYSDALESIVNVITAVAAYVAIWMSAKPPDSDHPFGHSKAEFLAAMFEGAMIAVAAVLIMIKAYNGLVEGVTLNHSVLGLSINSIATVINTLWAWAMIKWGTQWRSPALVADGHHLFTDVITSVGVVIALILALMTGWYILDPLIAAVVAVNILMMGYRIATESMSRLMDEAASPEIEARIRGAIEANGIGALQAHDIRTRQAGRALFIEFHLVVPGSMTVDDAHAICDRLENSIEKSIEGSEVVIHVEPEYKAKPEDSGAVPL
ncbi:MULTISPECIES: cation diffusion facilitator family transporter [unclassified Hyphomicrobium]|uniref:cation diffusion facilitator family transporter n=1 Tax=unclassified Hyphomicrobium TaxID=2619925 RepID=UPI000213DCBF|nr:MULTISPECIES: cation diffusion facilitator family transporter [unclassified Hyphomicrobium]CCB63838.1 putative cation efflux pump fieF [Hyphomicrobium sp. MC1]